MNDLSGVLALADGMIMLMIGATAFKLNFADHPEFKDVCMNNMGKRARVWGESREPGWLHVARVMVTD